jgi:hypothetical protein
MSDFLARIATRSRGTLETLQPRPVSIFEPAGPGADLAPPTALGRPSLSRDLNETIEASETSDRGPLNRSPEHAIGETRQLLNPVPGSAPQFEPDRSPLQFEPDRNEVSGPRIRIQRRQRREAGEVSIPPSPEPHDLAEAGENSRPLPQTANLLPAAPDARTNDNHAIRPLDQFSAPRLAIEPDESATTDDIRTIFERHPINGPQVRLPSITFSPAAAKAPASSRFQPTNELPPPGTDETVVNVTIGRLEVRAITPQLPTRSEPRQSAVMSLDEYLKRERGARR